MIAEGRGGDDMVVALRGVHSGIPFDHERRGHVIFRFLSACILQPYLPYTTFSLLRYCVSGNHLSTSGAFFQDSVSFLMTLRDCTSDTMDQVHSVVDMKDQATFLSIVASADEYVWLHW